MGFSNTRFGRWIRLGRAPTGSVARLSHGDVERPIDSASPPALIELHQVSKIFESAAGRFAALKMVSLSVQPGEFVGIVGKSGCGKSTLINAMTGIDRPTSGEIIVARTVVNRLSESEIAEWRGRNVGVIFQFFQLLPMLSAVENVMLPMDFCDRYDPKERPMRALELLEQVGIADEADKLPAMLAGGQQQRVAIARALANDPPLIVADEPTGNLDSKTANAIFDLFAGMIDRGKTIVMVTHDRDLARRVSRTVTLADGEIISDVANVRAAVRGPAYLQSSA